MSMLPDTYFQLVNELIQMAALFKLKFLKYLVSDCNY